MKGIDRRRALALLEAYEPLLTKRQSSIMDAYFRFDLSLAEIASEEGLTRAGALDAIKVSIAKMEDYEVKLGLIRLQQEYLALLEKGDEESLVRLKEIIAHGI